MPRGGSPGGFGGMSRGPGGGGFSGGGRSAHRPMGGPVHRPPPPPHIPRPPHIPPPPPPRTGSLMHGIGVGLGMAAGMRRVPPPPPRPTYRYVAPPREQLVGEYARRNQLQLASTGMISRPMSEYFRSVQQLMPYARRVDSDWVQLEVPLELILIPNTLIRNGDDCDLIYDNGLLIADKYPFTPISDNTVMCYVYYKG